jgi:hypothetical protein
MRASTEQRLRKLLKWDDRDGEKRLFTADKKRGKIVMQMALLPSQHAP